MVWPTNYRHSRLDLVLDPNLGLDSDLVLDPDLLLDLDIRSKDVPVKAFLPDCQANSGRS